MGRRPGKFRRVPLARPTALRDELARVLPDRPFRVTFWDGTTLEPDNGTDPIATFRVRSPQALAHALMAPGQLGIGRAYVSGALEVDDLDATLELLDTWKPPALDARAKTRLAAAAVRATGLTRPPRRPAAELRTRARSSPAARRRSRRRSTPSASSCARSLRCSPASGCWTWAAAGARSPCTPPSSTAST
jgi:cyclopropane-fatty-acyl-phospholipid synthase